MLLNCSKSWCKNSSPSTGKLVQAITADTTNTADTINICIPIDYIRKANIKLIERKYYIELNNQKDTIINLKDKYIEEQNKAIIDLQNRIQMSNNINESIKKDLDKQLKINKILYGTIAGCVASTIIVLLFK